MKVVAVGIAAAIVASAFVALTVHVATSSAQPEPVRIAISTATVNETEGTRSDVLLLWNRNERSVPIGHGVKSCIKSGAGGLLGGGIMTCTLILELPLGKVVAAGIVHNIHRYTLTITGGTGRYLDARGPLFVRPVGGDGIRRLTFVT